MVVKTFKSPSEFELGKDSIWLGYGIYNLPSENIINGRFQSYKEDEAGFELNFVDEGIMKTIKIEKVFFQKGLVVVIFHNNFSNGPL